MKMLTLFALCLMSSMLSAETGLVVVGKFQADGVYGSVVAPKAVKLEFEVTSAFFGAAVGDTVEVIVHSDMLGSEDNQTRNVYLQRQDIQFGLMEQYQHIQNRLQTASDAQQQKELEAERDRIAAEFKLVYNRPTISTFHIESIYDREVVIDDSNTFLLNIKPDQSGFYIIPEVPEANEIAWGDEVSTTLKKLGYETNDPN